MTRRRSIPQRLSSPLSRPGQANNINDNIYLFTHLFIYLPTYLPIYLLCQSNHSSHMLGNYNQDPTVHVSLLNVVTPVPFAVINGHYLETETFKKETPETIRRSLQQGEWVTSLDCSNVYFHIPSPRLRKYMYQMLFKTVRPTSSQPFLLG